MTITEFLTARYDEDEAQARSAIANRARAHIHPGDKGPQTFGPVDISDDANLGDMAVGAEYVLADIAAKRAILEHHGPATAEDAHEIGAHPSNDGRCVSCVALHDERGYCEQMEYPCPTVIAMVQPYAAHADFDPAWSVA